MHSSGRRLVCALPYDTIAYINLHMPDLCNVRKSLRENSIDKVERDSQGFGFALHLSLMFSFLLTRAHYDSKTITVSQGVPNRIYQLLLRVATDKV